jgi:hypothetical protein
MIVLGSLLDDGPEVSQRLRAEVAPPECPEQRSRGVGFVHRFTRRVEGLKFGRLRFGRFQERGFPRTSDSK